MSSKNPVISTRKRTKNKEPKTSKKVIRDKFFFILDDSHIKVFVKSRNSSTHIGKIELGLLSIKNFTERGFHELKFSTRKILERNCTFHLLKADIFIVKKTTSIELMREFVKLEPGEDLYTITYDEHLKPKGSKTNFYQNDDLKFITENLGKPILMDKFLITGINAFKKFLKT